MNAEEIKLKKTELTVAEWIDVLKELPKDKVVKFTSLEVDGWHRRLYSADIDYVFEHKDKAEIEVFLSEKKNG